MLFTLSTTEAFFDNLMELPMNMAGYMSVARASTECEDQVDLFYCYCCCRCYCHHSIVIVVDGTYFFVLGCNCS